MLMSTLKKLLGTMAVVAALGGLTIVPAQAHLDPSSGGGRVKFVTFTAELSGANEIPGPGDPDGFGAAEVNIALRNGVVCFGIVVIDIALPATAAHIHEGAADVAGPVVVTLEPPEQIGPTTTGASTGCVTGVSESLLREINRNPDEFYVNVHNAEFPAGAVRGQLAAA
jgi:hypothetical protein